MNQRTALAALVVVVALVVIGRATQPAPPEAQQAPKLTSTASPGSQAARQLGPLPATLQMAPTETPMIDLSARLATRRRIEREGTRVYLDSLFAGSDSVVIRWGPDHGSVITVRFEPDTLLGSWRGALEDARTGMRIWDGNPSGFQFRETTDTAADIVVRWEAMMGEESQLGLTSVTWDSQGIIRGAVVTLGLLQNPDSIPAPPPIRRRVAAHEFGHALGLPHSDRTEDLMFRSSPAFSPSRRDMATLQLLYSVAPGPIRTP